MILSMKPFHLRISGDSLYFLLTSYTLLHCRTFRFQPGDSHFTPVLPKRQKRQCLLFGVRMIVYAHILRKRGIFYPSLYINIVSFTFSCHRQYYWKLLFLPPLQFIYEVIQNLDLSKCIHVQFNLMGKRFPESSRDLYIFLRI